MGPKVLKVCSVIVVLVTISGWVNLRHQTNVEFGERGCGWVSL